MSTNTAPARPGIVISPLTPLTPLSNLPSRAAMSTPPRESLLECLPSHIIDEICEQLVFDDATNGSVSALAATCRHLYSASKGARYRTVRIGYTDSDHLMERVDRLAGVLWAGVFKRYVRRLVLAEEGVCLATPNPRLSRPWPVQAWAPDEEGKTFVFRRSWWPVDADDEFWSRPEPTFRGSPQLYSETPVDPQHAVWSQLAGLISSLPGLKDIVFRSFHQIPACIFTAINDHRGPVRLHMDSCRLRKLFGASGGTRNTYPHAYLLASSPRLTSLRASLPVLRLVSDVGQDAPFGQEAVCKTIRETAPNLKSVSIYWDDHLGRSGFSPQGPHLPHVSLFQRERGRPGSVSESGPAKKPAMNRGSLETLALAGYALLGPALVVALDSYTDLGVLRSLHLRTEFIFTQGLEHLFNNAGALRSLKCLSLWAERLLVFETHLQDEVDPKLAHLLRSLRPLESLDVCGMLGAETFDAIVHHHAGRLNKLRVIPSRAEWLEGETLVLTRERVEALATACPNITDLELLVPRRKGSEEEAGIYRALARLRRLNRLSLLLDCSSENRYLDYGSGPHHPDEEKAVGDREERDAVINAAIDSTLALSIAGSLYLDRPPRLIRLQPINAGNLGQFSGRDYGARALNVAECLSNACVLVRHDAIGATDTRRYEAGAEDWSDTKEAVEIWDGEELRFLMTRVRHYRWRIAEDMVRREIDGLYSYLRDIWPEAGDDFELMSSFPLWGQISTLFAENSKDTNAHVRQRRETPWPEGALFVARKTGIL